MLVKENMDDRGIRHTVGPALRVCWTFGEPDSMGLSDDPTNLVMKCFCSRVTIIQKRRPGPGDKELEITTLI
jgi:hypothetical protein